MKSLDELVQQVSGFTSWRHADKIRFFAWYLHAFESRERFEATDIARCYDVLHLEKPSSISPFLAQMEKKSPREMLRDGKGYYLERRLREKYDEKYGSREITLQVTKLLTDLPEKVPDLAEKDFLKETLICFRNRAFRATIVMCWNLAYFHLCQHVLANHLATFNGRYPLRFPEKHKKARVPVIAKYEDFSADLKESEVIEICKSAGIISSDVYRILEDKLDRRNSAAHPSTVIIGQLQAEEYVDDLVKNIILKLPV